MKVFGGRVTESGQVTLPEVLRKAIGLDRGGDIVFELDGREIRIRTLDGVIDRAQHLTERLLGNSPDATVDAFLAHRRRQD